MILYSDPADYAPKGQTVFPDGLGLPKTGAQRGSLAQTDAGDPRTPFYPSKNYTYEYHSKEYLQSLNELPNIPVTPIGYEDARNLFDIMDGKEVPESWKGEIQETKYHYSSKNGTLVNLVVNNQSKKQPIRNVIASVTGAVEPDKFILVCNHYDAWSHGAVDPNSGTIAMLEMSRVLMRVMNETGWRPRRSIIFAAWDSEEYGLIGSTEWVEDNLKLLEQRGVATLNVDIAVKGGVTLQVSAVPMLFRVMMEAAKMVKNPSANDTIFNMYPTVYDNWRHYQNSTTKWDSDIPKMTVPSGGSDHASFINYVGMPVSYITYQSDPESRANYALYHSMFETDWMVENLLDPYDFTFHRAVTQFWLTSTIALADSLVIPFNVSDYGWAMTDYIEQLFQEIDMKEIVDGDVELIKRDLQWATEKFKTAASSMQKLIDKANSGDSVKLSLVQALNMRLSDLEKAFINPRGLPDHPLRRHVVFAPSSQDLYSGAKFPSLTDSYSQFKKAKENLTEKAKWKSTFNEELTSVRYSLDSAIEMLKMPYV